MKAARNSLVAWSLLAGVAMLCWYYHRHLMPVAPGDMDPSAFSRGIGTPLLLWLNGYLGVFLNLRYLGPVAALGLPLVLLGVVRWKYCSGPLRGLLALTLLSVLVIGGFGGFNYRYALTLQPLLTVAVVAVGWRILTGRERRFFVMALAAVGLWNTGLSLEHRKRTWHAVPTYSSPDTKPGTMKERLDTSPRDLEAMLAGHGVKPTDTVLVNNLPIWYYISTRPGIYFWCGSDQLFLADGKPFLFRDRTDEQVMRYLLDSLHCRYIFSTVEYNLYHPRFNAFVEKHSEMLEQDDRGHTLHRLKDTFGR